MCLLSAIRTGDRPHLHGAFVLSIITNSSRDIFLRLRDLTGYPFTYYNCSHSQVHMHHYKPGLRDQSFIHDQDRGQEGLGI